MIKRIKGSLFAKVFILTVAVLLCVSFLVYGVLAWYMPQTYSNNLNAALDEQTSDFIYELEHIRMQDSGGLFDQFLQNTTISMVELYTADGVLVETPSNQNSFNDGITGEALGGASYESAPIISNSYYFSFADDNNQYILTVYGEASQIAELRQSFVSILPILFCVILLVSLATAWVYSRIITNPVLKISRISKEMSDMKLEWQLEERRSDELGVLENSLNTLSRKLSATLEELQSANLQLQKDIEHQKVLERAQQDFFSSASHDLKTPITIIKGQLEGMLLGLSLIHISRYAIYMATLGNRPDLFPDSPYVNKYITGKPGDYEVPGEYLDDETFAAMLAEAQKYIGYPYVWGGSSPATSFDCSGYVSWVINHSGWNVGRLGAQGLYNICTPTSSPKPGDLVFFKGTYDTPGVSHCGIYVGDGKMLHCGDPIGYANLNTSYWQSHFYAYGRLP